MTGKAGNVLSDIIASGVFLVVCLTRIFRQAQTSCYSQPGSAFSGTGSIPDSFLSEKHMLVKEKPVLKNVDEFLAYVEQKKGELDRCGNGSRYTPQDASGTATEILRAAESAGCYDGSATPVVQIVNAFEIDLRRTSNMLEGISGVIYAGGRTRDAYGSDAIIFTDSTEPYGHQRFVAAHELGHYLFDYIGNPGCLDNSRTNASEYRKHTEILGNYTTYTKSSNDTFGQSWESYYCLAFHRLQSVCQ